MDERLENYLDEELKFKTASIFIPLKEVADDLHTSRVVISRLLKDGKQP
jgi:CRP/FNR family transcriptional regulator